MAFIEGNVVKLNLCVVLLLFWHSVNFLRPSQVKLAGLRIASCFLPISLSAVEAVTLAAGPQEQHRQMKWLWMFSFRPVQNYNFNILISLYV